MENCYNNLSILLIDVIMDFMRGDHINLESKVLSIEQYFIFYLFLKQKTKLE